MLYEQGDELCVSGSNAAVVTSGNLALAIYEGTTLMDSFNISYKSSYTVSHTFVLLAGASGLRTFRVGYTLPTMSSGSIVLSNAVIRMQVQY